MSTTSWILLANRSRADIRQMPPKAGQPCPVVSSFEHPEGRLIPGERDSDEPGRVSLRGGARSAIEPHTDRELVESQRFAVEIATALELSRQQGKFHRLIVIAPPKFLGALRNAWSPSVQKLVAVELDSDLVGFTENQVQDWLSDAYLRMT